MKPPWLITASACLFAVASGWLIRGYFTRAPESAGGAEPSPSEAKEPSCDHDLHGKLAELQARLAALEARRGESETAESEAHTEAKPSVSELPPGFVEPNQPAYEAAFAEAGATTPWADQKLNELRSYTREAKTDLANLACRGSICRLETNHPTARAADDFLMRLTLDSRFGGVTFFQTSAEGSEQHRILFIRPADPPPA